MFSHGQKKLKKSKEDLEKQHLINVKTEAVCRNFLNQRRTFKTSEKSLDELLEFSAGILEMMSDQSTVINYRQDLISMKFKEFKLALKEALGKENKLEAIATVSSQIKDFIKAELKLNGKLVKADLKSYQLWFHRLWVLRQFALLEHGFLKHFPKLFSSQSPSEIPLEEAPKKTEAVSKKVIAKDLQMCEMFLTKDERNFHTWNYRFNLWKILLELYPEEEQALIDSEIKFINQIHKKNYSNYSAIHFKIKFFEMKLRINSESFTLNFLFEEMEKINQGLYISPNEQALYIYQKWILRLLIPLRVSFIRVYSKNGKS